MIKQHNKLHKKGVFFTFMSVVIVGVLVIAVISDRPYTTKNRIPVIKDRVKTVDNFIKSIKSSYMERALSSTAYMAMYSVNDYLNSTNQFLEDLCVLDIVMVSGMVDNTVWSDVGYETKDVMFQLKDPDDGSLSSNTNENGVAFVGFGFSKAISQSLKITTEGILDSVSLNIQWQNGNADVIVELRKGDCVKPGWVIDSAVITQTEPNEGEFQKKIRVYPGQRFYLVVKSPESATPDSVRIQTNTDQYAAGQLAITDNVDNEEPIDDLRGLGPEEYYMEGNTLLNRIDGFTSYAENFLHLQTDIDIISIYVNQTDLSGPWSVQVEANYTLDVDAGIASWHTTKSVTATFSIIGMWDLYYLTNTVSRPGGPLTNRINKTNISHWNLENLKTHLQEEDEKKTYKFEPQAPSFLMRLQNIVDSSDCCGIESIIYDDSDKLEHSYVDYCYFGQQCPGSVEDGTKELYHVEGISEVGGIYPDFKLELYHITQYNLTANEITWVCCEEEE